MLNSTSRRKNNSCNRRRRRWRQIVSYNRTKRKREKIVKLRWKRNYRYKFSKRNKRSYKRLLAAKWVISKSTSLNKFRLKWPFTSQEWNLSSICCSNIKNLKYPQQKTMNWVSILWISSASGLTSYPSSCQRTPWLLYTKTR